MLPAWLSTEQLPVIISAHWQAVTSDVCYRFDYYCKCCFYIWSWGWDAGEVSGKSRFSREGLCFMEIAQLEPEIVMLLGQGLFGWGGFVILIK